MTNIWHPKDETKSAYWRCFVLIQKVAALYNGICVADKVGLTDALDEIQRQLTELRELLLGRGK